MNSIRWTLLPILLVVLLSRLVMPAQAQAPAQSKPDQAVQQPEDGQFAYVQNDDIYLAEMAGGSIHKITQLSSGNSSSSPVWSTSGRYLMYQQQIPGAAPALIILDLQTGALVNTIPDACCGAWNPREDTIIYITEPGGNITTAGMDNSNPNVLWPEISYAAGRPMGPLAWATNGQVYIGTASGDYFTQVWMLDGDLYPLSGPDYGGAPSSDCLMAPATPNSLMDQLIVTADTNCMMFAPGGPVTFVRDGSGMWIEVGMGNNADWIGGGPWLIWEQMTRCTDGPGFCRGGIGLVNIETGESQALIDAPEAGQPAWRPGDWRMPAPTPTQAPQPLPPTPLPIPSTPIPPTPSLLPPATPEPIPVTPEVPTPQPEQVPPEVDAANFGTPLPGDGYEPKPGLLEQILSIIAPPVEASSAEDCQKRFFEGQCTWFVAGKRPDACQWIKPGMGNAHQWLGQAIENGGDLGVTIRSKPQSGDIVVWQADCGGTTAVPSGGPCTIGTSGYYEGCGHVAYVTWASEDGKTIKIEEANWSVDRNNQPMQVLSCMSFISSPGTQPAAPAAPIPTPNPQIVPTPAPKGSNPPDFLQWLLDLFKK